MELLVYVRNHCGPKGSTSFVGASVGIAPKIERLEPAEIEDRGPATSLAEFRIDARVDDPIAELRAAVADVFTIISDDKYERAVYFTRNRSAIKVKLEPGFDTPLDVERELAEMLALCDPRVKQRRLQAAANPTLKLTPVAP
jgi:hypothetical protein